MDRLRKKEKSKQIKQTKKKLSIKLTRAIDMEHEFLIPNLNKKYENTCGMYCTMLFSVVLNTCAKQKYCFSPLAFRKSRFQFRDLK